MATNVLDTARFKYTVLNQMNYLNRREYIRNNEIPELPAAIPSNREELTGFIQQLFHYGLRKHMPGCPVRVNNNVLSLRLDGVQHRQGPRGVDRRLEHRRKGRVLPYLFPVRGSAGAA